MKCNICGETLQLTSFHIDGEFGYHSSLDSMHFHFNLCKTHTEDFLSKGLHVRDSLRKDDCVCFFGKYFSSDMIVKLTDSFQYVPIGYFNNGWTLYTAEEEQLMWENNEGPLEVLSYERILELSDFFSVEYVSEVIDKKYPDKPNPFSFYTDQNFDFLLNVLPKEELVKFVKKHVSRDTFLKFFEDKHNLL